MPQASTGLRKGIGRRTRCDRLHIHRRATAAIEGTGRGRRRGRWRREGERDAGGEVAIRDQGRGRQTIDIAYWSRRRAHTVRPHDVLMRIAHTPIRSWHGTTIRGQEAARKRRRGAWSGGFPLDGIIFWDIFWVVSWSRYVRTRVGRERMGSVERGRRQRGGDGRAVYGGPLRRRTDRGGSQEGVSRGMFE